MLYELYPLYCVDQSALVAVLDEFAEKDKDSLPEAFNPMGNVKVNYALYIGRFKVVEYTNCMEHCFAYVCSNTKAVTGLISIRKYFSPTCEERKRLGDVEFAVRPSHRGFGFGTNMFKDLIAKCKEVGVTEPIFVIPKKYETAIHMICRLDHTELEPATNYDTECRRFQVKLN